MNNQYKLIEEFNNAEFDKSLKWFSPPKDWEVNSNKSKLIVKPDKETDFWQKHIMNFKLIMDIFIL